MFEAVIGAGWVNKIYTTLGGQYDVFTLEGFAFEGFPKESFYFIIAINIGMVKGGYTELQTEVDLVFDGS